MIQIAAEGQEEGKDAGGDVGGEVRNRPHSDEEIIRDVLM